MRSRALRAAIGVGVSAALVAFLTAQLDWPTALEAIRAVDGWCLAIAAGAWGLSFIARGLRFAALVQGPPVAVTTAAVGVQSLMNRIAPFRLGELSLPYLLKRYAGAAPAPILLLLLLVRIAELGLILGLLVIATIGTIAYRGTENVGVLLAAAAFLVGIVAALLAFRQLVATMVRAVAWLARKTHLDRARFVGSALDQLAAAASNSARLRGQQRASLFGWTVVVLVLQILMYGAVLRSFGVTVGLLALVRGACVTFAGLAIPVPSVGTVGALEASWVIGFVWAGVGLETAILTGVVTQVSTLLLSALLAGPCWALLVRHRAQRAQTAPHPPH